MRGTCAARRRGSCKAWPPQHCTAQHSPKRQVECIILTNANTGLTVFEIQDIHTSQSHPVWPPNSALNPIEPPSPPSPLTVQYIVLSFTVQVVLEFSTSKITLSFTDGLPALKQCLVLERSHYFKYKAHCHAAFIYPETPHL